MNCLLQKQGTKQGHFEGSKYYETSFGRGEQLCCSTDWMIWSRQFDHNDRTTSPCESGHPYRILKDENFNLTQIEIPELVISISAFRLPLLKKS
jgi:hypothetical protein